MLHSPSSPTRVLLARNAAGRRRVLFCLVWSIGGHRSPFELQYRRLVPGPDYCKMGMAISDVGIPEHIFFKFSSRSSSRGYRSSEIQAPNRNHDIKSGYVQRCASCGSHNPSIRITFRQPLGPVRPIAQVRGTLRDLDTPTALLLNTGERCGQLRKQIGALREIQ